VSDTSPDKFSGLPKRYLLPMGLVSAITVALIFAVSYFLLSTSVYSHVLYDEASFRRFMATRVRPACTMAEIKQSLGDGVVVTEKHRLNLVTAAEKCSRHAPESWPDGAKADDQFIGYNFGLITSYLQFRDGVLVNFDPHDYDNPSQVTVLCP